MPSSTDERIQPALHALLLGDAGGLRAALEVDPAVVTLKVGGSTLLELTTQPDLSPPSAEIVDVLVQAGTALDRALNLAGCWNLPGLCAQLLTAGPYRPNWADVGRPASAPPSDDPSEVVGEAFVFAALNDRRAVVDYLLDTGVDVDARPYRNTTSLHFAIQFRRHDMVRHLLDRGASTTIEDDTYQSDAAGWAQACDDGSEAAVAIRELIGTT